jgi:ABC-type branched-subunit amino acid transport system substrate-binding protein
MFKKYWLILLVLALLVFLVPSCGGSGNKTVSTLPPTSGSTAMPITTPAPLGPVEIGAISSWSGPAAISGLNLADPIIQLVEKQVKDQGGILGGRDIDVVRYDNHASTDDAQTGVTKLVNDEKVSAITMGGVTAAEIEATAAAAEETKVLFVAFGPTLNPDDYQFTISATFKSEHTAAVIDLMNKVLKPKTLAILSDEGISPRRDVGDVKTAVEAAGTKTVYEQYIPLTNMDFTSYLTEIKDDKPDVLYLYSAVTERVITVAKQILAMGGLGDTKVVTLPGIDTVKGIPSVQGWYLWTIWIPGLNNPGSVKFTNDYQAMFGQQPTANDVYYYNCLWTAIYAIKLAGTDTDLVKIAQAARSGNLEWDTPMGRAHYMPDGSTGLRPVVAQIMDGKLVQVTIPQ